MLKYKTEVENALRRTQNLIERAKSATNLRDQVSRAYYACYHAMLAAIWLELDFNKLKKGTAHKDVIDAYTATYSKTKGNRISRESNAGRSVKLWKQLRVEADYDVIIESFEDILLVDTIKSLKAMYDFVDRHIIFITSKLDGS